MALLDMLESAAGGGLLPGGPTRERDPKAFRDDCFDDDDSSPLLAAYAHPCGFLFAAPETLASDAGGAIGLGSKSKKARRLPSSS